MEFELYPPKKTPKEFNIKLATKSFRVKRIKS